MSLLRGKVLFRRILALKWLIILGLSLSRDLRNMPQNISNPKGKLMLGYLEDGSDNEHLQVGELFLLCWPCHPSKISHTLITALSRTFLG